MTLYTRPQLALILLLAGAAAFGLAVDHWRRAHPEPAERLENLDRAPSPVVASPRPAGPAPLDINHATEPELAGLPGIGPALAARIVAARPFADVDELRRVRGLRRTTLERLRRHVVAGRH
jgi:DNA uptake protein ComE-like DNA-binding protein